MNAINSAEASYSATTTTAPAADCRAILPLTSQPLAARARGPRDPRYVSPRACYYALPNVLMVILRAGSTRQSRVHLACGRSHEQQTSQRFGGLNG